MTGGFLTEAPLWLAAIVLFAAMAVSRELGMRAHRKLAKRADAPESGSHDEGFILSSVLGLLALLLAFAFSLALDRHEQRRALIVAEANALGTAADRLQLLDDPQRTRLTLLLRQYARARLSVGAADTSSDRSREEARASRLAGTLTTATIAAARPIRATALGVSALDGVSALVDLAAERKAAADARLPSRVLDLMALYCVVSAGMLGYTIASTGSRHRVASYLLFALFAFAFVTILDLDRPRSGAIRVSQQALVDAFTALPR